ncbi:BrnT family toxin [Candidatus Electrothrix sp.]|uniref:BrnT family toxin n=1 Tax=Candidatus Electrothrix sp. TaxID=2170559 RepID=UPI0040565A54
MEFEWDPHKAETNVRKHQVSFPEAATVFRDSLGITVYDPDHSDQEDRFISIGMSKSGRLLMVAHTDRGSRVRIISARELNRSERKAYENEIKRRKGR